MSKVAIEALHFFTISPSPDSIRVHIDDARQHVPPGGDAVELAAGHRWRIRNTDTMDLVFSGGVYSTLRAGGR